MKRLLSIARLNFKEATKDKFFFGVAFFFIFYLLFCVVLGKLSPGHMDKVLRDAGLVGIEITTLVLVLFSYINSFFKEKDSRILEVYLSNVGRGTYITGKLLGFFFIALFYIVLTGFVYSLILFAYKSFTFSVLGALYMIFLKISIMISISAVFSSFFSSSTIALLSSLFLYVAAETAPAAVKIVSMHGHFLQRVAVDIGYAFLPNMDKIDVKQEAVYGNLPGIDIFLWVTFYVLAYNLFLWLINLFIFRKKEW